MAQQRNPDDPSRSADDPYRSSSNPSRSNVTDDEIRRATRLDNELQPDLELAEGPAGAGRIAMFAIAIAVILGAVFYGLNSSSIHQAGTSPTVQNTQQGTPPAAPTPRANSDQGVTTGAAPTRPQTPPSSAPTGQDMNRSGNPPASNAPGK
jgi:hypothetical protein